MGSGELKTHIFVWIINTCSSRFFIKPNNNLALKKLQDVGLKTRSFEKKKKKLNFLAPSLNKYSISYNLGNAINFKSAFLTKLWSIIDMASANVNSVKNNYTVNVLPVLLEYRFTNNFVICIDHSLYYNYQRIDIWLVPKCFLPEPNSQ